MTAAAKAPEPIEVLQPDGHPISARLTIPSSFVTRFQRVRALERGDRAPLDHHVAMAVLYDEPGEQPDAQVAQLAHVLSDADLYIRNNPGTRVVAIDSVRLHAGTTNKSSGLFARSSPVPAMWQTATVVIPCRSLYEGEILGSSGDSPELNQIPEEWYVQVNGKAAAAKRGISVGTTRHVVTPKTVDEAEDAALGFLDEKHGALLIGDAPISEFFAAATGKRLVCAEAEPTRMVATLAAQFLSGQHGYKSLGLR